MTPRMQEFLTRAAQSESGKGILVRDYDSRIASKATSEGLGWMITSPLKIFIIDEKGRAAIAKKTETAEASTAL